MADEIRENTPFIPIARPDTGVHQHEDCYYEYFRLATTLHLVEVEDLQIRRQGAREVDYNKAPGGDP